MNPRRRPPHVLHRRSRGPRPHAERATCPVCRRLVDVVPAAGELVFVTHSRRSGNLCVADDRQRCRGSLTDATSQETTPC